MKKNKYDESTVAWARQIPIAKLLGRETYGRKIFIRCPFHNERSASMVLYPDGTYHCYGCSAHGVNAIDFLMGLGSTFNESIEEILKYK